MASMELLTKFMYMIKLLFIDAMACVKINELDSSSFTRVRKNPLALYLLLIIVEVLNKMVVKEAKLDSIRRI